MKLIETPVPAAVFAWKPATKGLSVWKMGKQFCSGTITATVLGIVCLLVRRERSLLQSGKPLLTTMQQFWQRNRSIRSPVAVRGQKHEAFPVKAATVMQRRPKAGCLNGPSKSNWPLSRPLTFRGASLLIAASCTAYAYASFHEDFIVGRITLIGCPKLDGVDYSEKLSQILKGNDIRDILLVRMEVPCCGGLEKAVERALDSSGKEIPFRTLTITTDGKMK